MYYFDSDFLQYYLDQGIQPKVLVGGRFLDIPSKEDISDPQKGYGIDERGQTHSFDYRMIEKLIAGQFEMDLGSLQTHIDGEEEPEEPEGDESMEDQASIDAAPEEEEPPQEGKSNKTLGRIFEVTNRNSELYKCKGVIVENDTGGLLIKIHESPKSKYFAKIKYVSYLDGKVR